MVLGNAMQPGAQRSRATDAGTPSSTGDFAPHHFSTEPLAPRDRVPFWCEVFARKVVRVAIEPQSDLPFQAEATLRQLPGLRVLWTAVGTPACFTRTPAIVAEGEDTFAFLVNLGTALPMAQHGREAPLGVGDAVTVLHSEPATMVHSHLSHIGLIVPCAAVAPLVDNFEDAAMRVIPRHSEPLRLLSKYLELVRHDLSILTPELAHLVATHIHDLVAAAIGTTRDGAAVAARRGLHAARLHAVKADILDHLDREDATVDAVAARQRITPRYVQKLFEGQGTTFSQFVLEERLIRARHILTDPRCAGWTIASIAFAAGFGDLSYFNRTFRRRFGATPSDVRAASAERRLH
jgi:AraC-like DNA-binding protein